MGRELRRVPLDFAWPLNKTWEGFLNPHFKPCPGENVTCFGGYSAAGKWLEAVARLITLIGNEAADAPCAEEFKRRGRLYPHPYLEEWQQAPRTDVPRSVHASLHAIDDTRTRMRMLHDYLGRNPPKLLPLTREFADLVKGLTGHEPGGFGGCGAEYELTEKLKAAAGITNERWGVCPICDGHAQDPASRAVYEAWEEVPPPEGHGYQLWETVSEGSPVSPVFATEGDFIRYLIREGYSEGAARNFVKSGWCMSGSIIDGVLRQNIETCGDSA